MSAEPLTVSIPNPHLPGVTELLADAVTALGGAEREGQVRMAEAVATAVRTGEHVAVQAGTGTGKSLAYLVPAVHYAVERGRTVVVSTATIALQRQLVDRDLPRLAKALTRALGREPRFAILKGRRNYLCMQRVHTGVQDDPDDVLFDAFAVSRMGREVKRLHEWSSETVSGDRDELVPGVSEAAWRQVSVSARECLGGHRCPIGSDCFAERARAEAARADIVVTNHALLSINTLQGVQVLPEHDVVVIDEAHDLVDRMTTAAAADLGAASVRAAAKRCFRLIDQEVSDRLVEAGEGFGLTLRDLRPGRLEELPRPLAGALTAVRDATHAAVTALGPERREDPQDQTARKLARAMLDEVLETAGRMLTAFDAEEGRRHDVVWVSGDPTGERDRPMAVHIAPLSVAGLLRERLFGRNTVVLTSATLALGGSFDTLARQWGLPPAADRTVPTPPPGPAATDQPVPSGLRWTGMDVGSPFEHQRSGILYIARHLPPPGRDGLHESYLDELTELVISAGGRTLGLFSSTRAAKQAAETLRERLGTRFPILCQGDDATGRLVTRFAEDEATCLFGTLSLWQGVDVPGPSLQLVVMDRIPFPRPDDPLASARQRAIAARGGNGFLAVAGTHAALLLAQGAGRLLRSMTDRGVIAVLDPRLATARYGGFLRSSLPPFWTTHDPDVAKAALRRIDT